MKCKPDNGSKIFEWTIQKPLSRNITWIWANWKNQAKTRNSHYDFNVDEDGSVTLNSNSIRLEDAGIYTCVVHESPKQPERYSAQLIVFESDPQCRTNMSVIDGSIKEFDYVAFQCAVNYSGHWTPSMQWSKEGNALNSAPITVNINISQDVQQLRSVINLQVKAEDNDALITCQTLFIETTENFNRTNAKNVPEYLFYWNTTLNVLFGPRNTTITPQKGLYRRKDILSCKAVGNPSPSYTWRMAQQKIADGPQLALNDVGLDANQHHVIECIAQNQVFDETIRSSATIDIRISDNYSVVTMLVGIICAILLLIVIAIGTDLIKEKQKTQANLTKEKRQNRSPAYENVNETEIDASPSTMTIQDAAIPTEDVSEEKSRIQEISTNENLQRRSPDYESIHEVEINAFPATSSRADETEDVSEGYSALMDRPVIVYQPIVVFSALEASSSHNIILQDEFSETTPTYANIVQHTSAYANIEQH